MLLPTAMHIQKGAFMEISDESELRRRVVDACKTLQKAELVKGTCGNVGVRTATGFLISPSGVPYATLTPDAIVKVNWDGSYEGRLQPSTEWRLHRDLFTTRSELNAIVHTHSPHATAVAVLGRDIPAIHYSIAAVGGPTIRCAEYATYGTQALADHAVSAMDGRYACLLAHHGVLAAHMELAAALSIAQVVDDIARYFLLCLPIGQPPILSDEQIRDVLERNRTYGQRIGGSVVS